MGLDRDGVWLPTSHEDLDNVGTNTHAELDSHVGSQSNPHLTSKVTVGLGSVTNDAQIKRTPDFTTFAEKTNIVDGDYILLEDSEDSEAKKFIQVGNLPSSPGVYIINLRAGDFITSHDANFAPVETLTGANLSRLVHSFDYNTTEFLRHEFVVPADIDAAGTVNFVVLWMPRVNPASAENVVFEIESVAIAAGELWDTALASKMTFTSAADTTLNEITSGAGSATVADLGWVAGDTVVLRFSRDSDNVNDTLDSRATTDDDALVFGLEIKIPLA